MADTLKRGGHAASAWTESDPSGGRVSSFTQGDAAAMVEVTYAESAMADDVVRLDEVWRLFEAGAPVLRLGSPVKPLPWSFVGAAMVTVSGIRHEVVVIDRRGNVAALESRRRIVGKKHDKVVRDQKLGKVVRDQVMRYAQPEERNRAKRASAKLNEGARLAGQAPPSSVLFTSGAAGHILADPERRGIDVGLPAIQWSYKTVDRHGTERIVASSDQGDTAPSSHATACVAALVVDEFGRPSRDTEKVTPRMSR